MARGRETLFGQSGSNGRLRTNIFILFSRYAVTKQRSDFSESRAGRLPAGHEARVVEHASVGRRERDTARSVRSLPGAGAEGNAVPKELCESEPSGDRAVADRAGAREVHAVLQHLAGEHGVSADAAGSPAGSSRRAVDVQRSGRPQLRRVPAGASAVRVPPAVAGPQQREQLALEDREFQLQRCVSFALEHLVRAEHASWKKHANRQRPIFRRTSARAAAESDHFRAGQDRLVRGTEPPERRAQPGVSRALLREHVPRASSGSKQPRGKRRRCRSQSSRLDHRFSLGRNSAEKVAGR